MDKSTTLEIAAEIVRYGVPFVCDMVQKANSGHPGGAASSFPATAVLFAKHLNYDPQDPKWVNRDRFILSAGHESALLYYFLYNVGYLPKKELENFRQAGSLTAGHPEYGLTPGVEVTTGPLSTGLVTAVGIAMAERYLHAKLGSVIDHHTYVLASDGDLEEENAKGAAEIASLYSLSKLIVYYDDNDAQIDGKASEVIAKPYEQVFKSFGWNTAIVDGTNLQEIDAAITAAKQQAKGPTLIVGKNKIGRGIVGYEGNYKSHGAPVGEESIVKTKEALGLNPKEHFIDSTSVQEFFKKHNAELQKNIIAPWETIKKAYVEKNSEHQKLYEQLLEKKWHLPALETFEQQKEQIATRTAAGKILEALGTHMPGLFVSAADTASSNYTHVFEKSAGNALKNAEGRYCPMGVRESAMAGVANGIGLHSGTVMITSTYLTFSDFMRPFIRLGALMKLPAVYLFTHDSFYLGEDGPTHQPIEHLFSLRAVPNLFVYRPADAKETSAVIKNVFEQRLQEGPALLALTRQNVPVLEMPFDQLSTGVSKGGYVLYESKLKPQILLAGTGSEVHLAMDVAKKLEAEGTGVRVVSIPCLDLFEKQDGAYQKSVIPDELPVHLFVEAGSKQGWGSYVEPFGKIWSIDHFGESAPAKVLAEKYGYTVSNLHQEAKKLLAQYPVKKKKLLSAWG